MQYAKARNEKQHFDYYIFGHRHLPLKVVITDDSMYYNLGDWIKYKTYGVLSEGVFKLKTFPDHQEFNFDQIQSS